MTEKPSQLLWRMWANNFDNARRFFRTKGNLKTKCKYKAEWYKQFEEDINKFVKEVKP